SGPKLSLSLEERKLKDDHVYQFDDLEILIHEKDMVDFNNTKVDYMKDAKGRGKFQILAI
ncbi:MAG: hypothetical protein Q8934_23810, partial [Bacillota bacterium]|nr:hypothetical protein [Bacillota bacterium]